MPQATERAGLLRRSEEVESHAVRVALVEVITGVPGARLALEFLNKNTDFKTSIESRPGVEFEKDCIPPNGGVPWHSQQKPSRPGLWFFSLPFQQMRT